MNSDIQQKMPWLQSSWSQLLSYSEQRRIPHALLLSGHKGLGKLQLAKLFARSLLCDTPLPNGDACKACHSCRLFEAETHPDFFVISPEEDKVIPIDAIRKLIGDMALKPQFQRHRVVIIHPAERLNTASANAFLKYLEEPGERTSVILVSDKPLKLPATIRSRCQKMLIGIPEAALLRDWLKQQGVVENTELLVHLSQGAPLLAKQMANSSLLTLRSECFQNWLKVSHPAFNFLELAEQWSKLGKAELEFVLLWVVSWVADMIKLAYVKHSALVLNPDFLPDLQQLTEKLDLKGLYSFYDFLLQTQKRLDTQLNKQLMIEEILINWLTLNNSR